MAQSILLDQFVRNLRDACKSQNLSQSELAKRSGVHSVTISRILNRRLSPTVEICERLAVAAGLEPAAAFLERSPSVA